MLKMRIRTLWQDRPPYQANQIKLVMIILKISKLQQNQLKRSWKKLNEFKACGPENMHSHMLNVTASSICVPLSLIFKESIQSRETPDNWRVANVIGPGLGVESSGFLLCSPFSQGFAPITFSFGINLHPPKGGQTKSLFLFSYYGTQVCNSFISKPIMCQKLRGSLKTVF